MEIRNLERVNQVRDLLGLKPQDFLSIPFKNIAVPVLDINPKEAVSLFTSKDTTGSFTLTPDVTRNFRISTISYSYFKDAACDIATGFIGVTITLNGGTQSVVLIPVTTLTAEKEIITLQFPFPLIIDKGSSVACTVSFTAGVLKQRIHVSGYYI